MPAKATSGYFLSAALSNASTHSWAHAAPTPAATHHPFLGFSRMHAAGGKRRRVPGVGGRQWISGSGGRQWISGSGSRGFSVKTKHYLIRNTLKVGLRVEFSETKGL
ncbi:hypothetical protein VPH35_027676 [Triticum aestivum]